MASPNVVEFTGKNFESEVLASDTPVLVDFWAEWCSPCRILSPTIDQLADEFAGRVKIGKVDIDAQDDEGHYLSRELAARYGISAIPTVILFKDGEIQKRFTGLQSKGDFVAAIEALQD